MTALFLRAVCLASAGQTVALTALQDSFVREQDPPSNFGASGLLCAAGSESVNGLGEPRGRFDSILKFDASSATAAFDSAFGAGQWALTGVVLQVSQLAAPENAFFPRGPGTLELKWLSEDTWSEGTGTPNAPQQPAGNEVTWQSLAALLTTATERSLGVFAVLQATGVNQYALPLDPDFKVDMLSAGMVSVHIVPQTTTLGFTFHSRNFGDPNLRPQLLVTAAPIIRGDMNCDGILDIQDVAPFALSLIDSAAYAASFPACDILRADVNQDGSVDGADVPAFTTTLLE